MIFAGFLIFSNLMYSYFHQWTEDIFAFLKEYAVDQFDCFVLIPNE